MERSLKEAGEVYTWYIRGIYVVYTWHIRGIYVVWVETEYGSEGMGKLKGACNYDIRNCTNLSNQQCSCLRD